MARVFTYDPRRVTINAGGDKIDGFARGAMVSVAMTAKQFNYHQGLVDGVRTHDPNLHGTITIHLLQGSPSNVTFDQYLRMDIEPGVTGYFPLLIFDTNGPRGSLSWTCRASTCWVSEYPNWSFHNDVQTRTWILESNNIEYRPLAPYPNIADLPGATGARPLDV